MTASHARLRERCPVHHFAGFPPEGFYTLSRHVDVAAASRDTARWSSRYGPGPVKQEPVAPGMLLNADPPLHTNQRRLVQKAFTPRRVAELEPRVRQITDELLDGFAARGTADLVEVFAYPLPVIVIAEMLGVPSADHATFKRWSDDIVAGIGGNDDGRSASSRRSFASYFTAAIEQRHALLSSGRPLPEDLVSGLVEAEYEGRTLDVSEMLGILVQLLVAGNETTTSMLTNLIRRLCEQPELQAALRAEPALHEVAIEESLRYDAPVMGLFRTPNEPVVIDGVEIPADAKVMLLYASANRDADVWEEPDRFRLDRDAVELRRTHLAFGAGAHHCVGAPLARLEGRVALGRVLDRLPNLRLAGEPTPVPPFFLQGCARLPVTWDAT